MLRNRHPNYRKKLITLEFVFLLFKIKLASKFNNKKNDYKLENNHLNQHPFFIVMGLINGWFGTNYPAQNLTLNSISGPNFCSLLVLSVGITDFERSEEFLKICGADFCPHFSLEEELGFSNANLSSTMTPSSENMSTISTEITPTEALPPSHSKIYIMTTINLALILSAAAILAFIIDPLSRWEAQQ